MPDLSLQIAENVAAVRERIAEAAARSGRAASDVALVAVTKYVSADWVRPLVAAGCNDFGESRPQQLWEKAATLADLPIRWHMIGHLQRNKIHRTLPLVSLVHSVDSSRLAAAIEEEVAVHPSPPSLAVVQKQLVAQPPSAVQNCPGQPGAAVPHPPKLLLDDRLGEGQGEGRGFVPILLEVNTSGEVAKHGLAPNAVEPLLIELANDRHLAVRGLMCMASLEGGLDAARRDFAALRALRDRLRPNCPPGVLLDDLSMGMSGDFEVAIEEGATIVRVGSALFEGAVGK